MNILKNNLALWLVATAFIPATAHATKTVTSPYVTKGKLTAEWRGGYEENDDDDNEFRTRNQIAYGFTDFYELKLSADTRNSGETDLTDIDVENKFQLAPKGAWPVDVGVRLDYTQSLNGGGDGVGGKILFGKTTGKVSHLANIEAGREVGGDSSSDDWEYGFSYAASVKVSETISLGGEWYSDFGDFDGGWSDQDHRAGPVLYGSLFDKVKYQAGVLGGLSRSAPDVTYKATINYSWQL